MSLTVINIGICGLGTVGQGVWKHIERARPELEARLGAKLVLARASVRDLEKKRVVRLKPSQLTTDPLAVATDPEIQIVCELIGGTGIARQVTLAALKLGKTVVSANKALPQTRRPVLLRGLRRRRHPDHQGPARGPRRESFPPHLRHSQRHL
jgi:homoserine dehydrogenase